MSPEALRKATPSKYFAIAGLTLILVGTLAFLNSLSSGGGYLATVLIIFGFVLLIGAIVRGIIQAVRRS